MNVRRQNTEGMKLRSVNFSCCREVIDQKIWHTIYSAPWNIILCLGCDVKNSGLCIVDLWHKKWLVMPGHGVPAAGSRENRVLDLRNNKDFDR